MIEEKAKSFLVFIWFSPPIAPILAEEIIRATFCHVKIIKDCVQFILAMIWGNQKCTGATPAFKAKLKLITSKFRLITLNVLNTEYKRVEKIIKIEAIA